MVNSNHLFIPNWNDYKHHIERKFAGDVGELAMFDFAIKNHINVFLMGEAGTGKTESAYWYASKTKRNIAVVQANGMTSVDDLLGTYVVNPETGKLVYQPSAVADVVANGGVLLLDEIFKMPRTVQSVLHSLLDSRRCLFLTNKFGQTRIDAHPDLLIIAGGNPNYKGDSALNEAFYDRFAIKVEYTYDKRIESKIVQSDSLRELAGRMRQASTFESYASTGVAFETPIGVRLMQAFEVIAKGLAYDFAVEVFINNFSVEERPAVKQLLEGVAYNIKQELGLENANIAVDAGSDE